MFKKKGDISAAIVSYKKAIALKPNPLEIGLPAFKAISKELAKVYAALGQIYQQEDQLNDTIIAYWHAATLDPTYWIYFGRSIRSAQFSQKNELIKDAILFCLNDAKINPQHLALPGISLMKLEPCYNLLWTAAKKYDAQLIIDQFSSKFLSDPLLLALLNHAIIPDPQFEILLTFLRRIYLQNPWLLETNLPLLRALAEQCQSTEYIYRMSDEEKQAIHITSGIHPTLFRCYRALKTSKSKTILPLHNLISKKVQAQYEENPYPCWKRVDQEEPKSFQEHLEAVFPYLHLPSSPWPDHPRILIAGCGTGFQAITTAIQIKNSTVTALDLSAASLAYARQRAEELHVSNIEFVQGDILEIPFQEPFDIIECVGVLHHMENALTGWKILCSVLKQQGWMCIGLYSAIARRDVIAARQYIAQKGYSPSLEGIRQCRQDLLGLPKENLMHQVTESLDFYCTSSCRDLLFNAHETYFSIPQIAEMLKELNLNFLGFYFNQPWIRLAYSKQYPNDREMKSLENWHHFEIQHPNTFINMYQFWVSQS